MFSFSLSLEWEFKLSLRLAVNALLTGDSEKVLFLSHYSLSQGFISIANLGDYIAPLGSFAKGDFYGMGLLMNRLGVSSPFIGTY